MLFFRSQNKFMDPTIFHPSLTRTGKASNKKGPGSKSHSVYTSWRSAYSLDILAWLFIWATSQFDNHCKSFFCFYRLMKCIDPSQLCNISPYWDICTTSFSHDVTETQEDNIDLLQKVTFQRSLNKFKSSLRVLMLATFSTSWMG